ncbi:MAG: peroxidase family protein [Gammaproteobacteria bacterium]
MKNTFLSVATLCALLYQTHAISSGQESTSPADNILDHADNTMINPNASPVRRIERNHNKYKKHHKQIFYRTIDGSNNNLSDHEMNAADTELIRVTEPGYSDQSSAMAGSDRPSPREVSNHALSQSRSKLTDKRASDFLWQWGQFLDHDIDITDGASPEELVPITIPTGDPQFDPDQLGNVVMNFNRSIYEPGSNPRQQLNEITGWIDASNVYGSDEERAIALRKMNGSGKLKTSKKGLLPFNTAGLSNAGGSSDKLFLAGDVRANEQIGLTTMHTLFVREHNRLAKKIKQKNPRLSGDQIYQRARRIVAAQMQVITYNEFIPVLLGKNSLSKYKGYDPSVDARISNEFSTAAYRLGHSLLSPRILRLNRKGKETRHGHISLREAFFAPHLLTEQGNIGPILRGLASQACQDLDILVIDDVRNFLFGQPGSGGFDLASLNIQRGRDHGLLSYNKTRESLGLAPALSFADISSDPEVQDRLQTAYDNIDQIDLWVGGLAEDHISDALVGEVFYTILKDQFERLRDGDRFWYENTFWGNELRKIKKTTLAKIIKRNTNVGNELQRNVFITKNKKQYN